MRPSVLLAALMLLGCPDKPAPPRESRPPVQPASADHAPARAAKPASAPTPAPSDEPAPVVVPAVAAAVIEGATRAINAFGLDYYKRVSDRPGNFVVSPASISLAFAMTYLGAKDETAAEIQEAFRLGTTRDELAGFAALLAGWDAQDHVELAVANRLFGEKTLEFRPAYLADTQRLVGAALQPMDFKGNAEGARNAVNTWAEGATRTRVKDLLPLGSVDRETRLVLANAIYFKGEWLSAFKEASTDNAEFRAPTGAVQVPMMRQTASIPYFADDNVAIVDLPYKGGGISMMVVLPTADDGLAAVETGLTPEVLDTWSSNLKKVRLELALPKFRIEPAESTSLEAPLRAMGVNLAFDAKRAQFGAMAAQGLYISAAFHKAFIAVDENGTEAAAATAVVVRRKGVPAPPKIAFAADHPFLFFVRDRNTGTLLFMGRVADPRT